MRCLKSTSVPYPKVLSLYSSLYIYQDFQVEKTREDFDCMPMLESLFLARKYTTCRGLLATSETAIPRFRSYEGLPTNIISLVPRRPIYHLRVSGLDVLPTLWGSHAPQVLNFVSMSAI